MVTAHFACGLVSDLEDLQTQKIVWSYMTPDVLMETSSQNTKQELIICVLSLIHTVDES